MNKDFGNSTEKNGFKRIGYIRNINTYGNEIKEIASTAFSFEKLDEFVNNELEAGNVFYYNSQLEPVSQTSERKKYMIINTGYKKAETGESIYGGFGITPKMTYGVEIGTQKELFERWTGSSKSIYDNIFCKYLKSTANYFIKFVGKEVSEAEMRTIVTNAYDTAVTEEKLYTYTSNTNKNKALMYFESGYETPDGEKVWFTSQPNEKPEAKQRWFGIFCLTESELIKKIFAFENYVVSGISYSSRREINEFLDSLADKAISENWKGPSESETIYSLPVLKTYVENTYSRLCCEAKKTQRKIVDFNGYRYFNCGLLDKFYRQIIIRGRISCRTIDINGIGKQNLKLIDNLCAFSENDPEIAMMFNADTFPELATYYNDYKDIMFDTSLPIKLQDNHVFEDGIRRGRIPRYTQRYEASRIDEEKYNELLAEVARDFDSALKRTSIIAKRNYKLPVPQYIKEYDEIQFMLPIFLGSIKSVPDCILSLKMEKDGPVAYYKGTTILTPEMAFNNARLISGPELQWVSELTAA